MRSRYAPSIFQTGIPAALPRISHTAISTAAMANCATPCTPWYSSPAHNSARIRLGKAGSLPTISGLISCSRMACTTRGPPAIMPKELLAHPVIPASVSRRTTTLPPSTPSL